MMRRLRDMPINRKVTVVILLISTAVLLLAGASMVTVEFFTTRQTIVENMQVLADLLGRNSTAPLAFHRDEDIEEVTGILSALQANPQIEMARVFDEVNAPFGQYVRDDIPADELPARPPPDGYRFVDGDLEVMRPVELDGKRIGTIYLRSGLGLMHQQLALYAIVIGLILAVLIVMTLIVSPRLRRPIAEPILALADVARRVARDRDYSARAVKHSEDEVGLLTDAFNQMLAEIEDGQASLERTNRSMQAEIAERKAVEERLRTARDETAAARDAAEAANRAKDQFLAVLSHELRTPLSPVLLTLSLLDARQDQLPRDVREDIHTIRRHVELEARLIDDLLDLTAIARGKLRLHVQLADAHLLVQDAVKICCAERMNDLTLALDADQHHVTADPGRLLQVFWNVLNNATKFTAPGRSITVRSRNVDNGRKLRVEVIDQGIGIDPSALSRIFNAFEQAESASTRHWGGLGLGLAIARALIEAHGGTIEARSDGKDTGATLIIELPTVAAPTDQPTPTPAPPPPRRDATPDPQRALRILLVDDHEGTLHLLSKLLLEAGHQVSPATSVATALSIGERQTIDLVISDLDLPDGSGLDLMRRLRDEQGLTGICLSGFGMQEDLARSAAAGFAIHLTKPVDFDRLQSAIATAIRDKGVE